MLRMTFDVSPLLRLALFAILSVLLPFPLLPPTDSPTSLRGLNVESRTSLGPTGHPFRHPGCSEVSGRRSRVRGM